MGNKENAVQEIMSPGIEYSADVHVDMETIFPGFASVILLFLSSMLYPLPLHLSCLSLPGGTSLAV